MLLFCCDALYPARQAQWKVEPVLMHEVVTSQLFWPESGLQVPHVGGAGFARAIVAVRRTAMVVKCIVVVWDYR